MRLIWDKVHNIASIRLVEGDLTGLARDAWQPSDEVVFDLGAEGNVINIQVLDPEHLLAGASSAEEALGRVLGSLAARQAS
jgi:Protein of unknown function (DUF2283)